MQLGFILFGLAGTAKGQSVSPWFCKTQDICGPQAAISDSTKLPLAGGTMTGTLNFSGSSPLAAVITNSGFALIASSSTNGTMQANATFQVGGGSIAVIGGHVTSTGTLPTLSSCGSGIINPFSNDMRGSVTFAGGSQSSCIINFINKGGISTPFCTCSDDAAVTAVDCAPGVGTLTVSITVAANDTISYICQW